MYKVLLKSISQSSRRVGVLCLFLFSLVAAGCGSSHEDVVISPQNNQPAASTATIMYSPTLAGAANLRTEPVAAEVDAFRITGYNAAGDPVFGPQTFPKAAVIEFVVPTTVVSLLIEDMVNDVSIGSYNVGVSLTPGQVLPIVDAQLLPIPVPGPAGEDGEDGTDGTNGTNGNNGVDGAPGPTGPTGPVGPTGPQGPVGPVGPTGSLADAFIAVTSSSVAQVATNTSIRFDQVRNTVGGLGLDTTTTPTQPVVTVPAAGTYLVSYTLRGRTNASFSANSVQILLVDSSGTELPGTGGSSAGFLSDLTGLVSQTVSGQAIVVLSANATVGLRVNRTLNPQLSGTAANSSSAVMTVVRLQ